MVDDDEFELETVRLVLESEGFNNVQVCSDSRKAPALLDKEIYSIIVLDLLMPHLSGPDLLPMVLERQPHASIIFVSATNDVNIAIDLLRKGAHDYLTKPFDARRFMTTLRAHLEKWEMQQENLRMRDSLLSGGLPAAPENFKPIVTRSPLMTKVFLYLEAIAPTELPVLVIGETGVGKELVAEAVHRASGVPGPFVAVNLAGLDDLLFSDALFGHVKGAYTGAMGSRTGFIQQAAGGTLFLDEIGDLSAESQVKVLRLIQNREYYPLGSDRMARAETRFVFATNHDLPAQVDKGLFRKDLFYRLWSHRVTVPPLRDRREDIRPLAEYFLARYAAQLGKKAPPADDGFFARLSLEAFPGNVRELEGMVGDALIRHRAGLLTADSLPPQQRELPAPDAVDVDLSGWQRLPTIQDLSEALIGEALARAGGNQGAAARVLGISRTALNKRLHK
jgi:DNA-binding NtrC family response regulator